MMQEPIRLVCYSNLINDKIAKSLARFQDKLIKIHISNFEELVYEFQIGHSTLVLIDESFLKQVNHTLCEKIKTSNLPFIGIIQVGDNEIIEMPAVNFYDIVPFPINKMKLALSIGHAMAQYQMRCEISRLNSKLNLQGNELYELNKIGIALSAERDMDKLLDLILLKSREITGADAGSIYLVEKDPGAEKDKSNYFADKQLRFKLTQNDSVSIGFNEFVMPIEKRSIAGYVALTDQVLNLNDVYELPSDCDFIHNRKFDRSVGYRAKSMLVIPMKTHKDEIIGVLQLINRKRDWNLIVNSIDKIENQIIPFDNKSVTLASSLASQAAISIENNRLYAEIKRLFEGFIKASVHAIEQRDPTTYGHSERVATLTTALAHTVNKTRTGRFKDIHFTANQIQELNYAALLHDFGKIGVRENVLVKAKKLYPHELEYINYRFRLYKKFNALKFSREKIGLLMNQEKEKVLKRIRELDQQSISWNNRIEEYWDTIIKINEPDVMVGEKKAVIDEIGELKYRENGATEHLLTPVEMKRLSIPKGSLSEDERAAIELHVTHTFNFLSKIPWTTELKNIPEIAFAHHEKLDGSGYPRGLTADQIPIQSRMMTIADIYDALTAWDRPYKKAVPHNKALDILRWEVKEGRLDAELFNLFIEAKLFNLVLKNHE